MNECKENDEDERREEMREENECKENDEDERREDSSDPDFNKQSVLILNK